MPSGPPSYNSPEYQDYRRNVQAWERQKAGGASAVPKNQKPPSYSARADVRYKKRPDIQSRAQSFYNSQVNASKKKPNLSRAILRRQERNQGR